MCHCRLSHDVFLSIIQAGAAKEQWKEYTIALVEHLLSPGTSPFFHCVFQTYRSVRRVKADEIIVIRRQGDVRKAASLLHHRLIGEAHQQFTFDLIKPYLVFGRSTSDTTVWHDLLHILRQLDSFHLMNFVSFITTKTSLPSDGRPTDADNRLVVEVVPTKYQSALPKAHTCSFNTTIILICFHSLTPVACTDHAFLASNR